MDKKTILLIAAGVFVVILIIVALVSASTGHNAPAAAAAGTGILAIAAARRTLAESSVKAEAGQAAAIQEKDLLIKNQEAFNVQSKQNEVDISSMTLEEKVALALQHPQKDDPPKN